MKELNEKTKNFILKYIKLEDREQALKDLWDIAQETSIQAINVARELK